MNRLVWILGVVFLAACADQGMEQLGGVSYEKVGLDCYDSTAAYYLLNMKVTTSTDSLIFNSKKLGRKVEVERKRLDQDASFSKLLYRICPGDSIYMKLLSDSFYMAMGGVTPAQVKGKELLIWMTVADRLDPKRYLAHKQIYEKEAMADYIHRYGWNAVLDSSNGIYFEKLKTARTLNGGFKKAKMKYVVKTLSDELVAYSKENEPMIFDISDSSLLDGFVYVGSLLNESESIRALIPSKLAYGMKGNERVKGGHPIVLEMELIEIIE